MHTFGITHPGRRPYNEDRLVVRELDEDAALIGVADGMGGEAAGDYAAQIMIDTLQAYEPGDAPEQELERLVVETGKRILTEAEANKDREGMGTTVSAALVRDGKIHWVSLGDSRLYLYRASALRQISRDHSFLRDFLEAGEMTEEEARVHPMRHVMDQCAGTPDAEPDTGRLDMEPGDLLVVCTDGLHGQVDDKALGDVLADLDPANMQPSAEKLLGMALDAGGKDNITMVMAVSDPRS